MSITRRLAIVAFVLPLLVLSIGCPRYQSRQLDDPYIEVEPIVKATNATSQPSGCMKVERRYRREHIYFPSLKSFDVDNDGTPNYVFSNYSEAISITDRCGKQIERVKLKTEGRVFHSEVWPVVVDGRTQWAVQSRVYGENELGKFESTTVIELYDRHGERRWQFRLDAPNGYSGDPEFAVISSALRSSFDFELIVAWNYSRDLEKLMSEPYDAEASSPAQLVILDARSGQLLCQQRISNSIGHLDWIPATENDPPMVVYGADDELVTLRIDGLQSPN